jgi:hypothetical protein
MTQMSQGQALACSYKQLFDILILYLRRTHTVHCTLTRSVTIGNDLAASTPCPRGMV